MGKRAPIGLILLDGFGHAAHSESNAIALARKPFFEHILNRYPHSYLQASGQAVGLLDGTMGNSQVGHMTIGAGKRVLQPITIISQAIRSGAFFSNPLLVSRLNTLASSGKTLHVMGLLSDAGVHAHIEHLFAYITAAQDRGVRSIVIHPFLDGRDTPQTSAVIYLNRLDAYIHDKPHVRIGSIQGRFYAMDRDSNWDRTQKSYSMLTDPSYPSHFHTWQDALAHYYAQGITDEFIPPTRLHQESIIQPHDGIIVYNVRPERVRQLTCCFMEDACAQCDSRAFPLTFYCTPVMYAPWLQTDVLFPPVHVESTLKEKLIQKGLSIFTIAETEKFAHVTYFFDGGRETAYPEETRVMIPSIKSKTYANHPCMSAQEITQAVFNSLTTDPKDFYLINYANADMVGHSGDLQATIKAIECLDTQLEKLYKEFVLERNGTLYITADHGKAEKMIHDGKPWTAHTTNKVPFYALSNKPIEQPAMHELADISAYIMQLVQTT